jgi:hypothetical protein
MEANTLLLHRQSVQSLFRGYLHDKGVKKDGQRLSTASTSTDDTLMYMYLIN